MTAEPPSTPRERVTAYRSRYDAGATIRAIAAEFGVRYGEVRDALREAGVLPRRRKRSRRDELVRAGVLVPAATRGAPAPRRLRAAGPLSDLVTADRV